MDTEIVNMKSNEADFGNALESPLQDVEDNAEFPSQDPLLLDLEVLHAHIDILEQEAIDLLDALGLVLEPADVELQVGLLLLGAETHLHVLHLDVHDDLDLHVLEVAHYQVLFVLQQQAE
jgi:hypothetical protein